MKNRANIMKISLILLTILFVGCNSIKEEKTILLKCELINKDEILNLTDKQKFYIRAEDILNLNLNIKVYNNSQKTVLAWVNVLGTPEELPQNDAPVESIFEPYGFTFRGARFYKELKHKLCDACVLSKEINLFRPFETISDYDEIIGKTFELKSTVEVFFLKAGNNNIDFETITKTIYITITK